MDAKIYLGLSLDAEDPKVRIFGNPAGLRYLARILEQVAEDDQTKLHDLEPAEFTQIHKDRTEELIDGSLSLTVGRLDHKADGSSSWFTDHAMGAESPNSHLKDILAAALKERNYPNG